MNNYELDVRRLLCPMPVIKTQQRVKSLNNGDTLTIIATDPGAMHDVPAWCRMFGHQVINQNEANGEVIITMKVNKENKA